MALEPAEATVVATVMPVEAEDVVCEAWAPSLLDLEGMLLEPTDAKLLNMV